MATGTSSNPKHCAKKMSERTKRRGDKHRKKLLSRLRKTRRDPRNPKQKPENRRLSVSTSKACLMLLEPMLMAKRSKPQQRGEIAGGFVRVRVIADNGP
jgi:hypothetical protein